MKTRIVILAAGKGTRMNSEIAKVLTLLNGKPVIQYLLRSVRESGVDENPVIVVGHQAGEVKKALGNNYGYALQDEQLGTGHATKCARELIGEAENVIVFYGDVPLIKPKTIRALEELHRKSDSPIAMMTTTVPSFNDWHSSFYGFGRIIRNDHGEIDAIVEKRDATPEQLQIKEVNPGLYCFKSEWLWENLDRLKNENAAGEYYLTDLVHLAIEEGHKIISLDIDPLECVGINTPEDLALAENLVSETE